jgi:hypothetical protein
MFRALAFFAGSILLGYVIIDALFNRRVVGKGNPIRYADSHFLFWISVGLGIICTLLCFWCALREWKNR